MWFEALFWRLHVRYGLVNNLQRQKRLTSRKLQWLESDKFTTRRCCMYKYEEHRRATRNATLHLETIVQPYANERRWNFSKRKIQPKNLIIKSWSRHGHLTIAEWWSSEGANAQKSSLHCCWVPTAWLGWWYSRHLSKRQFTLLLLCQYFLLQLLLMATSRVVACIRCYHQSKKPFSLGFLASSSWSFFSTIRVLCPSDSFLIFSASVTVAT